MNKIKMKTTFLQVENFLSSQQHKERKEDILSKNIQCTVIVIHAETKTMKKPYS